MVEYRTQPVEPAVLLEELSSFCQVAAAKGIGAAILMFGWDSNLAIDEMWQDIPLPLADVVDYVRAAEQAGMITVGKSDIFVKADGLVISTSKPRTPQYSRFLSVGKAKASCHTRF